MWCGVDYSIVESLKCIVIENNNQKKSLCVPQGIRARCHAAPGTDIAVGYGKSNLFYHHQIHQASGSLDHQSSTQEDGECEGEDECGDGGGGGVGSIVINAELTDPDRFCGPYTVMKMLRYRTRIFAPGCINERGSNIVVIMFNILIL
jgi:hypothetical protein